MGKKTGRGEGRANQGPCLSFLGLSLQGRPPAPTCASSVCTQARVSGVPGGDLAAVSSEPGALGQPRQCCDLVTGTWHLSV